MEHDVGISTISDIKKISHTILKLISVLDSEEGLTSKKTMEKAKNNNQEAILHKLFIQKQSVG